jgi:hypothetical protein
MVPVSARVVSLAAAASLMIAGIMPRLSSVSAEPAQAAAPQTASTIDPAVLKAL